MRPLLWVCRAGVTALAGGLMIAALPASADTLSGFVATARAAGVRMSYEIPGFLVVEKMMDGGGPVAEVSVDSLDSGGFASLPFPGDTAIAYGSLLATATGKDAPASYPFYVSARDPGSPSGELSDPSGLYRLAAKATSGAATAEARLARLGKEISGGSTSTTSVVSDGQTVTATAVSRNEGIVLGDGTLQMGVVEGRSVTTYSAGEAAPKTTKSMVIEGGSASGTAFTMGPAGFSFGGGTAPVPFGDGLAQLNKGLAPAGISMGFAQGREPGSIEALEVVLTHPVPGVAGDVQGRYRFRIGETTTAVSAEGIGASLVVETKPGVTGPTPADAHPVSELAAAMPSAAPGSEVLTAPASGARGGGASFADALLAPVGPVTAAAGDPVLSGEVRQQVVLAISPEPAASAAPAALQAVPAVTQSILAPVAAAELLGWVLSGVGLAAVTASWALRRRGGTRWTS
jgi:hypothetical protein